MNIYKGTTGILQGNLATANCSYAQQFKTHEVGAEFPLFVLLQCVIRTFKTFNSGFN